MFTAAILAGGRARRMGSIDEGALRVGPASILERQLAAAAAATPHILIVAAEEAGTGMLACRWSVIAFGTQARSAGFTRRSWKRRRNNSWSWPATCRS
jgi:hypothetical protein